MQLDLSSSILDTISMFNQNSLLTSKTDYTKGLQAGRDEVIAALLEIVNDPCRKWSVEAQAALKQVAKELCEDFPAED